jgi:hypothetical protein
MKTVIVELKSLTGLVFGQPVFEEKITGESGEAFEERTWMQKLHEDKNGVFIPSFALKKALVNSAKYLQQSVPGKAKATYTKHFMAGVIVAEPIYLGKEAKNKIQKLRLFLPSNPKTPNGPRVWRNFPLLPEWQGTTTILLTDPLLEDKPDKVKEYLVHAGQLVGLLTLRVGNNGLFGKFEIVNFKVMK